MSVWLWWVLWGKRHFKYEYHNETLIACSREEVGVLKNLLECIDHAFDTTSLQFDPFPHPLHTSLAMCMRQGLYETPDGICSFPSGSGICFCLDKIVRNGIPYPCNASPIFPVPPSATYRVFSLANPVYDAEDRPLFEQQGYVPALIQPHVLLLRSDIASGGIANAVVEWRACTVGCGYAEAIVDAGSFVTQGEEGGVMEQAWLGQPPSSPLPPNVVSWTAGLSPLDPTLPFPKTVQSYVLGRVYETQRAAIPFDVGVWLWTPECRNRFVAIGSDVTGGLAALYFHYP